MIQLKDVGIKKKEKIILKDINIKFNRTGIISFVGGTDLQSKLILDIIAGFRRPDIGEIIINGKSSKNLKNEDLDSYRNTYVGVIKNDFQFINNLSISSNIRQALDMQGKQIGNNELRKILDAVGLKDIKSTTSIRCLNNFQKQMVAIARSLVKNPFVIVAYDPIKNLNAMETREFFKLLKRISQTRLVVIISKDTETLKNEASRYFVIKDNTIVDDSKVEIVEDVVANFGLIKPKLTLSQIQNNGLNSLFHKPIYSLIMILILTITISLYTILFNMDKFDLKNIYINALDEFEETIIYKDTSENKQLEIKSETNEVFNKEYTIQKNEEECYMLFPKTKKDNIYYTKKLNLTFTEENHTKIIGRDPINHDELVITKYIADQIIKNGIDNYQAISYESIINDQPVITIHNLGTFKIVGIKDDNMEKFEILKTTLPDEITKDINKIYEDLKYYRNTKLNRIYVSKNFISSLNINDEKIFNKTVKMKTTGSIYKISNVSYIYDYLEILTKDGIMTINKLDDDEIVISKDLVNSLFDGSFEKHYQAHKETFEENVKPYNEFLMEYIKEKELIVKTNIDGTFKEYKIVGIADNQTNMIIYNENKIENLKQNQIFVSSLYANKFSDYDLENTKTRYSNAYNVINKFIPIYEFLKTYGIFVLSILAVVLMILYLFSSIRYQKYYIHIYRLIGASKKMIKLLFISEIIQFIILLFLSSFFLSKYLIIFINSYIKNSFNIDLILINFDYMTLIIILISTLALSIIGYLIGLTRLRKEM